MNGDPEKQDVSAHVPLLVEYAPSVQRDFLSRVYALLAVQLLGTVLICSLVVGVPTVHNFFIINAPTLSALSVAGSLIALLPLLTIHRNIHPWNLAWFIAFTAFESCILAVLCALAVCRDSGSLVLTSFAITLVLFGSLSMYVHRTKQDFQWMQGTLVIACLALVLVGLVGALVDMPALHVLVAYAGIVVFSGFVLYDTSCMLTSMTPDDAIVASVQLYLDIVNLFLYILQCLSFDQR